MSQGRRGTPPFTSTGLAACLREGAAAFGWDEARARTRGQGDGPVRRGVGMAACEWIAGGGGPPAGAVVTMHADGSVSLDMGAADIGTGTKTVMAQVVAEELGVEPGTIRITNADTATVPFSGPSGGSKTVPSDAPAVRAAALEVKRQLLELAAAELAAPEADLEFPGAVDPPAPATHGRTVDVAALDGLRRRRNVVGVGFRGPNPEGKVVSPFAAQFCEVEVDTAQRRGAGAALPGRPRQRPRAEPQDLREPGGRRHHHGRGLGPDRGADAGPGPERHACATATGTTTSCPRPWTRPPEVTTVPIDPGDTECNTTGAKGLGEPVTIPTAAAIANAVRDACGAATPGLAPLAPAPGARPWRRAEGGLSHAAELLLRAGRAPSTTPCAAAPRTAPRVMAGGTDLLGCLRDDVLDADARGQPGRASTT